MMAILEGFGVSVSLQKNKSLVPGSEEERGMLTKAHAYAQKTYIIMKLLVEMDLMQKTLFVLCILEYCWNVTVIMKYSTFLQLEHFYWLYIHILTI